MGESDVPEFNAVAGMSLSFMANIGSLANPSFLKRRSKISSLFLITKFQKELKMLQDKVISIYCVMDDLLKQIKVCHNIRIKRCKLLQGEQYRGYNASKREYFYGVKIQLVTIAQGIPVEMYLVAGAEHDSQILKRMYHDLPPESSLYGDSAYTNYEIEDLFKETELVELKICRKSNSKRKDKPSDYIPDAKAYQCRDN